MKKIQKILCILICILQMLIFVPAYAQDSASDFQIDQNGVLIKYTGSGGDVAIPGNVKTIGAWAFENCEGLSSILIPDSVTGIEEYAFSDCENLKSATIPNSVTRIDSSAFWSTDALVSINVDENNSKYKSIDGVLFDKEQFSLVVYPASKPDSSYAIPDDITDIGDYAFAFCKYINTINTPSNLKSVGACAFSFCFTLESISLPDGLTNIGGSAFEYCKKLKTMTIPDSVKNIGGVAFRGCSQLPSINIPYGVTDIGNNTFDGCKSLKTIVIPDSVTRVGINAFFDCESLTSIVIADSVDTIGFDAFSFCPDVTIYGKTKSKAQSYALENNIPFAELISVTLNGKPIVCDQPPVIENGRVLVPFRAVFEALGADVYWNGEYKLAAIIKNNVKIFIKVDEKDIYKFVGKDFDGYVVACTKTDGGITILPDCGVTAHLINDRIFVPVRTISEGLGVNVNWDENTKTVSLTCDESLISEKNTDKTFFNDFIGGGDKIRQAILNSIKPIVNFKFTYPENVDPDAVINALKIRTDKMGHIFNARFEKIENNKIALVGEYDIYFKMDDYFKYLSAKAVLTLEDSDGKIILNNADVVSASTENRDNIGHCVCIKLTSEGRKKLAIATDDALKKPDGKNYISIKLDGVIVSAPKVMAKIDSDEVLINGNFDADTAKYFAAIINAGILPYDLQLVSTCMVDKPKT